MAFQIPDDLRNKDITLKQAVEILEIRRKQARIGNRLKCLPDKEAAMKAEIEELQKKEDAIVLGVEQSEPEEAT